MKNFLALGLFIFSIFNEAIAIERRLYVGAKSSEAVLTFTHFVELNAHRAPSESKVSEAIESQLQHLFGSMAAAKASAVPKGNHTYEVKKITKLDSSTYRADYSYEGTVVIEDHVKGTYDFNLPNNPATIYTLGIVGKKNPCTDEHYQEEGDFWYFWNPGQQGCPLKKGKDYVTVHAKLDRITNSVETYPEYERLVNENGQIKISLLMGMDEPSKGKDPNKSTDINADSFRNIKATLLKAGYKNQKLTGKEVAKIVPENTEGPKVYVENFSKTFNKNGKSLQILIQIFFGPSGIDQESSSFHYYFKDALENSSVMMYDGHSGLGGHLDLESIEAAHNFTIEPNQNRYQIYFFNSCSSYSYYNTMFFGRKMTAADPKGTKNLDIFTNGLATYFDVMHGTNIALIKAIELWASGRSVVSYQTLARQIDSNNLFGINGDEDNPVKP